MVDIISENLKIISWTIQYWGESHSACTLHRDFTPGV